MNAFNIVVEFSQFSRHSMLTNFNNKELDTEPL